MDQRRLKFNRIGPSYIEVYDFENESSDVVSYINFDRYLAVLGLNPSKVKMMIDKLDGFHGIILNGQNAHVLKLEGKPINLFELEDEGDDFVEKVTKIVEVKYDQTVEDDIFGVI